MLSSIPPVFLILVNVMLGSIGQVLLKLGTNQAGKGASVLSLFTRWPVLIGFGLYAISALLWLKILQNVSLSFAYPMIALSYVVVTLLDRFVLKDEVPPLRIVGLALICLGVVVVGKAGTRDKRVAALPGTVDPVELLADLPPPAAPSATPLPHHEH